MSLTNEDLVTRVEQVEQRLADLEARLNRPACPKCADTGLVQEPISQPTDAHVLCDCPAGDNVMLELNR